MYVRREIGGPGRDRTGDLFHAMEARSQLRHRPTVLGDTTSRPLRTALSILAEWTQIVNAPDGRLFCIEKAEDLAHHAVGLIGLE